MSRMSKNVFCPFPIFAAVVFVLVASCSNRMWLLGGWENVDLRHQGASGTVGSAGAALHTGV